MFKKLKKIDDPRARLAALQDQLTSAQDAVGAARGAVVQTIADGSPPAAMEVADRAEREATSRALNKRADRFEASLAPLVTALTEAADAASDLVLDYSQHEGFAMLARKLLEELPPAVTQLVCEQRDRAAATVRGNAPPNLPTPFVPRSFPTSRLPSPSRWSPRSSF
jgi:hypothetical protein